MPTDLVVAPEAEHDIAEAYTWYERRRAGLAEEFLSSVDALWKASYVKPEMYAVVHGGYQRSLVRRFPYAVFYEHAKSTVTI